MKYTGSKYENWGAIFLIISKWEINCLSDIEKWYRRRLILTVFSTLLKLEKKPSIYFSKWDKFSQNDTKQTLIFCKSVYFGQ